MPDLVANYYTLILASAGLAGLMLVQLLTADIAGLVSKHVPGTAVPQEHRSFLFRSSRALANTNESVAIFLLLAGLMVLLDVDPAASGYAGWTFLAGRVLHSVCYWLDFRIARSGAFVIALIGLCWMLTLVLIALVAT